jgi:hypothetical protein
MGAENTSMLVIVTCASFPVSIEVSSSQVINLHKAGSCAAQELFHQQSAKVQSENREAIDLSCP